MVPLLLAVACGADTDSPDGDVAAEEQFEQTWAKPYGKTTCDEWATEMTKRENFIFAADVLVAQWKDARGGQSPQRVPEDALITDFVEDIGQLCSTPMFSKAVEAATSVWQIDRQRYKE